MSEYKWQTIRIFLTDAYKSLNEFCDNFMDKSKWVFQLMYKICKICIYDKLPILLLDNLNIHVVYRHLTLYNVNLTYYWIYIYKHIHTFDKNIHMISENNNCEPKCKIIFCTPSNCLFFQY